MSAENNRRKPNIITIITGPELSGKSTLTCQLMVMLGDIYGTMNAEAGCPERISDLANMLEKLKTCYDIVKWEFETSRYSVTTNDIPGGPLFTKTMITGAFKADYALFVIDTSTDDYKGCFDNNAQEHSLLAFTLGVKQMICCLNKMDATKPSFAKSRYEEVKKNLSFYLTKIGYDTSKISFVPISALYGDNIADRSKNLDWYKGVTLLEAVDRIQQPTSLNQSLRVPIHLVTKDGMIGRVESGIVKLGMFVYVAPIGLSGIVSQLWFERYRDMDALPGDIATLMIKDVKRTDVRPGCVVSSTRNRAIQCLSFETQMYVLNGIIRPGLQAIIECHTSSVGIFFSKLLTTKDGKMGKTLRNRPESVERGELALVELIPAKPLVVERVFDHPRLGRFLVRDMNGTLLGVGVITAVVR